MNCEIPDYAAAGVQVSTMPGQLPLMRCGWRCRPYPARAEPAGRRSLELNFENNLLVLGPGVTATIRDRQLGYISQSTIVKSDTVEDWPFHVRLVNNAIGMASPLL